MNISVVILAAGKSARFHSRTPKILHPLGERPILTYTLDLTTQLSTTPPVLVVSPKTEADIREWGDAHVRYAVQDEPTRDRTRRTTSTSAARTMPQRPSSSSTATRHYCAIATLRQLVQRHTESQAAVTILTVERDDSRGFGRIVRDGEGRVQAIVEEVEATPEISDIRELNTGICVFDADALWTLLDQVQPSPTNGEYYLTDCVELAVKAGMTVSTLPVADPAEAIGINTRVDLAARGDGAAPAHQRTLDARRCHHRRSGDDVHRAGRHHRAGYGHPAEHAPARENGHRRS